MTTGATNDSFTFGLCPLTFGNWKNITNRLWSELPSDPDMLNATMCGPYNREGLLCGKCIDGYGLPVYSLHGCKMCQLLEALNQCQRYFVCHYRNFLNNIIFRLCNCVPSQCCIWTFAWIFFYSVRFFT